LLVSLVIDYNKMIIISENGNYNDYNKQKWRVKITSLAYNNHYNQSIFAYCYRND